MTTFNWTISNIEYTNDNHSGVTVAHWRCGAEDGDFTSSAYGTTSFTPAPDAEGFVNLADLTEETVLGWVFDSVSQEETETSLTANIEEQKAPQTVSGLPWSD